MGALADAVPEASAGGWVFRSTGFDILIVEVLASRSVPPRLLKASRFLYPASPTRQKANAASDWRSAGKADYFLITLPRHFGACHHHFFDRASIPDR